MSEIEIVEIILKGVAILAGLIVIYAFAYIFSPKH